MRSGKDGFCYQSQLVNFSALTGKLLASDVVRRGWLVHCGRWVTANKEDYINACAFSCTECAACRDTGHNNTSQQTLGYCQGDWKPDPNNDNVCTPPTQLVEFGDV